MMAVRPVFAGAYKFGIKSTLTHAVDTGEDGESWNVQCKTVNPDSVMDDESVNVDGPPTCKACLKKWLKNQKQ